MEGFIKERRRFDIEETVMVKGPFKVDWPDLKQAFGASNSLLGELQRELEIEIARNAMIPPPVLFGWDPGKNEKTEIVQFRKDGSTIKLGEAKSITLDLQKYKTTRKIQPAPELGAEYDLSTNVFKEHFSKLEAHKMSLHKTTTWTDGRGRELELHQIETDHLINIIGVLERRRDALVKTADRYEKRSGGEEKRVNKKLRKAVEESERQIDIFVEELSTRKNILQK